MALKVTMIFPSISRAGFGSFGAGMEESWISHGLCLVSAQAKRHGHDVDLLDLRKLKGWKQFENEIRSRKPRVVALTMMSVDYNPAVKCMDIIKSVDPGITIVVGGPHPSIVPEEVAAIPAIDHIIKGEGEISFVKLLEQIERNEAAPRIIEGERPVLDEMPFADRELFGALEFPLPVPGFASPFVTVIAGRGCLYNCSFCQPAERAIFGKKVRRRSVDNVLDELRDLRSRYNFQSMMIHDDCLTEDAAWVLDFCRKYREEFRLPFACQTRADIVCKQEDMIREMRDAGLVLFFIGFESGNQRILNFLRKGTKVEHNYRAAEICRKYGIKIWANYMFGVPTETKEEVMDTVRMIKAIKPDHYSPAFFTPHPGSDLFTYCEKHNLSLITNHDGYRRNATECKIKGIEYEFLFAALNDSMGLKIPLLKFPSAVRAVNLLRPFFNRHPRLKIFAQSVLQR